MEIQDLKKLIEFLKETDITELQIEKDGTKIRLKRGKFIQVEAPKEEAIPAPREEVLTPPEESQRLITIKAPLVGTFYRASSPDGSPFVEVGDKVKKGQVLCIIEAMKLMNEIESEVDGTLVKVLVENAQPIEYGEPLFLIESVGIETL